MSYNIQNESKLRNHRLCQNLRVQSGLGKFWEERVGHVNASQWYKIGGADAMADR